MTTTVDIEAPTRRAFGPVVTIGLLAASTLAGIWLMAQAMDVSRPHLQPPGSAYALFWLGFAIVFGAASFVVTRRNEVLGAPTLSRLAALASIATFGAFPRIFRGPNPLFFNDEFAQYWQTQRFITTGHIPSFNPLGVPLLPYFPGLQYATAVAHGMLPFSLAVTGLVVVLVAHGLGLFGVYALARALGIKSRGAAIAAVAYALNPSWLYFDAMYSYESLAVPLLIWALAAVAYSVRKDAKLGWKIAAFLLIPATIITHHATGMVLVVTLLVAAAVAIVRQRRNEAAEGEQTTLLLVLVGYATLFLLAWWAIQAHSLVNSYYAHYINQKLSAGTRGIAQNSILPLYEKVALWLQPFAVLAVAIWMWRRLRGTWRQSASLQWAMVALAAVFFISLPLVLTGGQEVAHRSWATAWLGLSVLFAAATEVVVHVPDRLAKRNTAIGVVLAAIITVGCVAASPMFPFLQFPGQPVAGLAGRVDAQSANSLARYIQNHPGNFFADNYVNGWIADKGNEAHLVSQLTPATATWLVLGSRPVSLHQVGIWKAVGLHYVVVDSRIGADAPYRGYWYQENEPNVTIGQHPYGMRALACAPWSKAVYRTGTYTIYAINLAGAAHASERYWNHGRKLPAYQGC